MAQMIIIYSWNPYHIIALLHRAALPCIVLHYCTSRVLPAGRELKRLETVISKYTELDVIEEMSQQLITVSFETLHPTPLGQ
jgi:hypothetical protein